MMFQTQTLKNKCFRMDASSCTQRNARRERVARIAGYLVHFSILLGRPPPCPVPSRIMPLQPFGDPSLLAVSGYVLLQEAYRTFLMRAMPTADADCGNQPCWRSALMFMPQLVGLPLIALARHGGSVYAWGEYNVKHPMQPAGRVTLMLFYWFLAVDFAYQHAMQPTQVLSKMMVQHHIVCLYALSPSANLARSTPRAHADRVTRAAGRCT